MLTSTLFSLYSKARYPKRIYCGILMQNKDKSEQYNLNSVSTYNQNIRSLVIPHYEAKGPLFARQMIIEHLYQNEEYYLQIDSHMEFSENWDELIMKDLNSLSQLSVISCYPISISMLGKTNLVPHMVEKESYFKDSVIDKYKATLLEPALSPRATPYLAAGFLFHRGTLLAVYPKDKIPYLFQGEEMLLLNSYKRAGAKVFAPTCNICAHNYIRNNEPKVWFDLPNWEVKERQALEQLKKLLFY